MVLSYLIHHGYSTTAEKFAEITGQPLHEDINSIKTRQSKLNNFYRFSLFYRIFSSFRNP